MLDKPTSHQDRLRVAVFGSFYRGFYVLHELLEGVIKDRIQVVGVATDDPTQGYVSPQRRVWRYPHTRQDETMVTELAARYGLPVHRGSIRTQEFLSLFEAHWRPELCIMATFGQRIPAALFQLPKFGFFNLHPCMADAWPSKYAGPNPFQALLDDGAPHVRVAMHHVNEDFDCGKLIAYGDPIAIPPHASVVDLHKITSVSAARLAATQIASILERNVL